MDKKILTILPILSLVFIVGCNKNENTTVSESSSESEISSIIETNSSSIEESFSSGEESISISESNITSSIDIAELFTITYNLDGGEATNPTFYTSVSNTFTLNNPIKLDYEFLGWTYENVTEPVKIVTIEEGSTGNLEFTANYRKIVKDYESLKIVVFADVQLCVNNYGNTANAYLALVNHLKYAKSVNADVLMMSGDIVNNAIEDYYKRFYTAFEKVYGTDTSTYPEFVWTMGNHEWWDSDEHETANAVALFNQYARIDTSSLVARSNISYSLSSQDKIPNYYKVVKGVPFVSISSYNCQGKINGAMQKELKTWLEEISNLNSVKNGGPIYINYHYPIDSVTYKGLNTNENSQILNSILKNYPNAIVFTGDTHYPSVNERTINQIDYTSINIGSSSYSRMVNISATSSTRYTNMAGAGKHSDVVTGDVGFKFEYTPNLMTIDFNKETLESKINRHMTSSNLEETKNIGIEWTISRHISKEKFIYTDARFENKEWANILYNKDGLLFDEDEEVKYSVKNNKMIVYFNDVIDYNYCEHYRISVIPDGNTSNLKVYDFASNYYKYDDFSHEYHFTLDNIPTATSYKVIVDAYDFFDNKSLNSLISETPVEEAKFADDIDLALDNTYCDISKTINYEVKSTNSNSSLEYYYRGIAKYQYGAILNRVVLPTNQESAVKKLSCTDYSHPILTIDVKNDNSFDLYVGLTVVVSTATGGEKWLTDFGHEYRKVVEANSDFITLKWDLLKDFGIDELSDIKNISFKASAKDYQVDTENGWVMHLYADNIDIYTFEEGTSLHEFAFNNKLGEDLNRQSFYMATTSQKISFEYKLVETSSSESNAKFAFMFYNGKDWSNYVDTIYINPCTNTCSLSYVTIEEIEDGWYKCTIDLANANYAGSSNIALEYTYNSFYMNKNYQNSIILLDNFIVLD